MGIAPLPRSSRSCAQIRLEVDSGANSFVDDPPRNISIVLATDWIFLIVHLFGDDRLWIRSGLSPSGDRVPS